jgi:serine O-acetyltransferase
MSDDMRPTPQGRLAAHPNGRAGKLAWALLKLLGVEIPTSVKIGDGLRLAHGAVGLVVHQHTILGSNVVLYQGVTLGRGDQYLRRDQVTHDPSGGAGHIVIEDDVIVGANAVVLFKSRQTLTLGRSSVIGANSTVLTSVPPGEIWAGTPAKKVGTNPNYAGYVVAPE